MRLPADRLISVATTGSVAAVAVFAAVVSYSHFFDLGRKHGQDGTSARLTPLSIDLLILAASLILLWSARNKVTPPWPIRLVLIVSVAATVAGNVLDAIPGAGGAVVAAVLNGWPGAAFVAAVEILIWLVRASRKAAQVTGPAAGNYAAAEVSYAATAAAGNPWSANQLQAQFGLTRAQAARVRAPSDAAAAAVPSPGLPAAAALNGKTRGAY